MNFQKMYNTRVLFGTQQFPKTKYNVHVFKSYFYMYGIKSGFLLYVLNALSDHHLFFFSNCDIIKDSVACYVVVIALFSIDQIKNKREKVETSIKGS